MNKGSISVKIISLIVILALTISLLPANIAKASEARYFTDESVIPGVRYSSNSGNPDVPTYYKIIAPATCRLNVRVYYSDRQFSFILYDKNWNKLESNHVIQEHTFYYYLKEGEQYYFGIDLSPFSGCYNYDIEFFYSLSTPTLTLKSEKAGKMTVVATKSDDKEYCDGYEIKYRKSGEKWTTKKVETTGALNTVLSGLSKGKTYTVKVRQYVEDDNNNFFYSQYSDKVKVKIK